MPLRHRKWAIKKCSLKYDLSRIIRRGGPFDLHWFLVVIVTVRHGVLDKKQKMVFFNNIRFAVLQFSRAQVLPACHRNNRLICRPSFVETCRSVWNRQFDRTPSQSNLICINHKCINNNKLMFKTFFFFFFWKLNTNWSTYLWKQYHHFEGVVPAARDCPAKQFP